MIDGGYFNVLKGYDEIEVKEDFRKILQKFMETLYQKQPE